MTKIEATANFANAYRAYQVSKGSTFNIEVATAFATEDTLNRAKHMSEADAIWYINDEAEYLKESTK